jgi:hypothetical protein
MSAMLKVFLAFSDKHLAFLLLNMVENGYTEYNTAAALQRGQMIDIYIYFRFVLFLPSPLV